MANQQAASVEASVKIGKRIISVKAEGDEGHVLSEFQRWLNESSEALAAHNAVKARKRGR